MISSWAGVLTLYAVMLLPETDEHHVETGDRDGWAATFVLILLGQDQQWETTGKAVIITQTFLVAG